MGKLNVVGDQVRKIRSAKGWSQEHLAAQCQLNEWDLSRGTLSKVEAGLRRVTDAEVYLLAKILGVPMANLFPGEAEVMKAIRNP